MGTTGSAQGGARKRFVVTEAERRVADLLPIEVDPVLARATVEAVPFWFHTFALNRAEGIYTPGAARDHRYRVCALPEDFAGMSVLDVGCFDGFYASSLHSGCCACCVGKRWMAARCSSRPTASARKIDTAPRSACAAGELSRGLPIRPAGGREEEPRRGRLPTPRVAGGS